MATKNANGRKTRQQSLGYRNPIALRLNEPDEKAVREMAAQRAMIPTTICRQAVREYLANHRQASTLVCD